jgi:hypothetical protein
LNEADIALVAVDADTRQLLLHFAILIDTLSLEFDSADWERIDLFGSGRSRQTQNLLGSLLCAKSASGITTM